MQRERTTPEPFKFRSKDERDLWKLVVAHLMSDALNSRLGDSDQYIAHLAGEAADAAVIEYRRRVNSR
jgi:hypothetical protein